jgi:acetylornithine deacetylase/succinyl-diaminopimelate desuccinylase-like protein
MRFTDSKGKLFYMMALGSMLSGSHSANKGNIKAIESAKEQERDLNTERALIHKRRKQGIKEYTINGSVFYARNENNAMRKARNKGVI